MNKNQIIETTVSFVKETLAKAEGGHDWHHINRVWNNAKHIASHEDGVDVFVVELGSLLHDIADAKLNDGDEEIGPRKAREFLESLKVEPEVVNHIENIIRHISFRSSLDGQKWTSLELQVVQDADRLDAIGAVGIARAFNYGGHKGKTLYDPDVSPNLSISKEEYTGSTGTTINHFYEKLFLLKDKMNTATGKAMAEQRHKYMQEFVEQFLAECEGRK